PKMTKKSRFAKLGRRASSLIESYYEGRNVDEYEAKRRTNPKWSFEESSLETVIAGLSSDEKRTIADVPVGTNRFYQFLDADPDVKIVYCIDYSADMLTASMTRSSAKFFYSKADMIEGGTPIRAGTVISYRFLNLFDFATIEKILRNLCATAELNLIFSIRLAVTTEEAGTVYQDKIHVHDRSQFEAALASHGFKIAWEQARADEKPGAYHIMHARRMAS
ncbi:MAG: hypothetical protein AAF825_04600, partial [Pseudomonadota bacterium]